MAQIDVTINGRRYQVACDDGQEERVRGLAEYLDGKVGEFSHKLGQVGDARLMLLAGLAVADELAEATDTLRRTRRTTASGNGRDRDAVAAGIDQLARRIEAIAERLENPQL